MPKTLSEAMRRKCRRAALAAADWYVRTQCVVHKPFTDANVGRFVYNYHMPTRSKIWGLSWTQARGMFVLINAYQVTGDERYSVAIQKAGVYLKGLQKLDARDPRYLGSFPEAIPAEHFSHPRDAMEAAEALVLLYRLTRKPDWLERARLASRWFTRHVLEDGWPIGTVYFDGSKTRRMAGCWQLGSAKFFYQLYRADGDVRTFRRAVKPMCDFAVKHLQNADGSMIPNLPGGAQAGHHAGKDGTAGACTNDDGAGVALIGAWRVLGDKRYLDSAVAFGDWMTTCRAPFDRHATVANFANLLLELHRLTRRKQYMEWVLDNLTLLTDPQVRGSGDPEAEGAFRGEDEAVKWYSGGNSTEYVNTRNTAYFALALFKLGGEAFGPGYSTYGWNLGRLRTIVPDGTLITTT